jgi:nucleotide-binding universal stress UspA family protein
MAVQGGISVAGVGASVVGVLLFLGLSLTVGRHVVASVIRWTNDTMTIEFPVITGILVIMLVMALSTELIGVHTALGAFVAGTLVGQSPILTEHIEETLRGFIVAFFSPIFFAVAGLGMDLKTLFDPTLLGFTLAVIVTASLGKFLGAFAGGRLGGLSNLESLALATGLNARGSTEVIIASIGLSLGALSPQLYTMIVAMAVITTMLMPLTLRWALARVPLGRDEANRLEKETAEERQSVPKMERVLAYLDDSANARLAAQLAATFAAGERLVTTVMRAEKPDNAPPAQDREDKDEVAALIERVQSAVTAAPATAVPGISHEEMSATKFADTPEAVGREAAKGYSIVFAGIAQPISEPSQRFADSLQHLIETFDGPVALAFNGTLATAPLDILKILVPTSGAAYSQLATEVALALASAGGGQLTALHVYDPEQDTKLLRGRARRLGLSVLADARRLGAAKGVQVAAVTAVDARPERAIRRVAARGRYDLIVVGAALRGGQRKFLGPRSATLVRDITIPMLLIVH